MKLLLLLAFFSGALGLTLLILGMVKSREKRLRKLYRVRYQQLLYQVEVVTYLARDLATNLKKTARKDLLQYYEESLRALEFFLHAMISVAPFGKNPEDLAKPRQLLSDAYQKFYTLRDWMTGSGPPETQVHELPFSSSVVGCFFCSRPAFDEFLVSVKVRLEKRKISAKACAFCASELRRTGTLRVLQVIRDGKARHWSEVPGYVPDPNHWSKPAVRGKPSLKLIHTQSSFEV